MTDSVLDLALVGGGLQNGLIALATLAAKPDARIAIFERAPALGGNHTWCFHEDDVPAAARAWFEPLVATTWPRYAVQFPAYERVLASRYACITAARFDEVVRARLASAPGAALYLGTEVTAIEPHRIVVRDGDRLREVRAATVIDARGPERVGGTGGWQKFVGLELELAHGHGLDAPILMDATVEQLDGFRFMYVLPLAADRVLVEDTRFSDGSVLDAASLRARVLDDVRARGWTPRRIVREEHGVLPMTWDADVVEPQPGLVTAGYQGGWFHPVTAYSLPVALRLATAVGDALGRGDDPSVAVAALVPAHRAQLRFARRLVRMMFRWFAPEDRSGVLEHFYRLPEETVRRFYALQLTGRDQARLFLGRPPRGLSLRRMLFAPSPEARA